MPNEQKLRKALLEYLDNPRTHASFVDATKGFPANLMNKKLSKTPYTPWMLLEHIRITQHDMIDFMKNPDYHEMAWPKDYWPDPKQKADAKKWNASVASYEKEAKLLRSIVRDPGNDLFDRIAWGEGQTMFREVMQIVDHGSYHIGELVLMRRILGGWKR